MARKFQNNILVNAVHPGYVPTVMTSRTGIHTVEEAANTVVIRVALLPDDGPSGVYFNKMEIAPFTYT
ncbi:putative (+)-neomenthol dehydrogenase [Helianthus anomalus]